MQNQLFNILDELVIHNNIRINRAELKLQLQTHPSYPSLHALTGVLSHFGIQNLALRIPVSKDVWTELPTFFIANILKDGAEQLVLVERKKEMVKITIDRRQTEIMSLDSFLVIWKGVLLAIEKDDSIQETTNNFSSVFPKIALACFSILLAIFLFKTSADSFVYAHFGLSLIGLAISIFIVKHELGLQSESTNRFCNLSEKTSCDAVLQSDGATLFGFAKMSDISLLTFSSYTLFWIAYLLGNMTAYAIILGTSLLAIPFVLYSIYYQYQVVQKWCPLCIAVAAVLSLQAITTVFGTNQLIDLQSIFLILLTGIALSLVWFFLKPLLKKQEDLQQLKVEHYRFKRNFTLFNALYSQQPTLQTKASIDNEIVLGNPTAALELILVTSPLCHFCKKAHQDIEHVLKSASDKVKVIIRFNVRTEDKASISYQVTSQLLHLYQTQGQAACAQALHEVYHEKANLTDWLASQELELKTIHTHTLNAQRDWCQTNGINFTPAFYVNDKEFPKEYDKADLLYFVDDLLESKKINGSSVPIQLLAS